MNSVASSACWQLDGTTARLAVNGFTAVVDLLNPSQGLHRITTAGQLLPDASLLGVQLKLAGAEELSLPETYVRGDDLVATYVQTPARPFRLQAYWRCIDPTTIADCRATSIVELQVSINTSLLDTQPAVDVMTIVAGDLIKDAGAAFHLIRSHTAGPSYCEAAHPSDGSTSSAMTGLGGVRLAHRLFDRPLEKGVILRSRVRAAFAPRTNDEAAARAIAADFAASEPPLTT